MRSVDGGDGASAPRRRAAPEGAAPGAAPGGFPAGPATGPVGLLGLLTGRPAGAFARDARSESGGSGESAGSGESGGSARPAAASGRASLPWRAVGAVAALLAATLVALGLVQKRYCFEHGWGGSDVFWHACFSDLPRLWVTSPLSTGHLPYSGTGPSLDLPVGTGAALWLLSRVVPAGPSSQQAFTAAWAVVAAACAVGVVVLTATTTRRHPERAVLVGVSPLLVTVALVSPELVGVLLVSLALWAWSRDRPVLAGAVFGWAAVSRTYALLVLAAVGLVALRAGVGRVWCRTAGTALLVAAAALFAVQLTVGGATAPYVAWAMRAPDYGSLVYVATLAGHPVPTGAATLLAVAGWVLAFIAGALFALLPRRRPAVAEVALVVLVVVLLTGKSVSVQASLWLLPLVALAGVSWWAYAAWSAAEVLYFVMVWLYIGGASDPNRALPAGWFTVFLVLRLAAVATLALWVLDRALHRAPARLTSVEGDPAPVREAAAAQDHDDAAGPAAGRRDELVVVTSG